MNSSVITGQTDYDYRFISYLISEVFSKDVLSQSAVYQSRQFKNHKFLKFDQNKLSFVQDVFGERTANDKKRFQELSKHINKRCTILRQNLKKKN